MINIMETPPTPLIAAVYVRNKKRKISSIISDDVHPSPSSISAAVYVRNKKRKISSIISTITDDEHPSAPDPSPRPSSISNCSTPTKVVSCLKKKKKKKEESPISASAVGAKVDNRGSGSGSGSQFEPVTPQKHMNKRLQKKQQQQQQKPVGHVFRWPRACQSKKRTVDNRFAREGALSSKKPRGPIKKQRQRQKKIKIRSHFMEEEAKEKWWEEHLKEVYSFISCIRSIQGDRRFVPWKGSVVDSVVGAFLTQNVSDILSSSAFISLAAQFPLHPKCDNKAQYKEEINRFVVETEVGIEKLSIETRIGQGHTNLQTTEGNGSCSRSNSEKATKEDINTDMEASSLDHNAMRCAKVSVIADAIKERGQHNHLAQRIKDFLKSAVKRRGSIDLEWLKKASSDEANEYLMSIYGLGVKSVECIRLLTLHQAAFPVDTNVGRIVVRLGWVPLEPCPEDDLLHLLTMYPGQKTIHKFIWPMLKKLDQVTLYELHCQMITFGKVYCTKKKPNCKECPMNAKCEYYASELASKTPTLQGTEGKVVVPDIEDILTSTSMSKPKIVTRLRTKPKVVTRLRTEHYVYELPNGHPLLKNLDVRLPDDPCPYLLAIWAPAGERCPSWLKSGILCKEGSCPSCSSIIQETNSGTLLVPVKTTMKGRFPLNGTYFQVNEVFADHSSSLCPISVPRASLQNLEQKTVYFGTSVSSIYRGLSKEKIQMIFEKGYICVRGFDGEKRVPRPLGTIWHTRKN